MPTRKGAHLNKKYWEIVDQCWKKMLACLPKTYESLKDIFDSIESRDFLKNFDAFWGRVQEGKSAAIMLIAWYSVFMETDIVPVVLTINLGSARNDFLAKMSIHGAVNKIIRDTISQEFPEYIEYIPFFQLQGIGLDEIRHGKLAHNQIPVLIQHPANLEEIIKLYHRISTDRHQSLLVLIDEYHKMYTETFNKRMYGLPRTVINKKEMGCQSMMYWFHEKVSQNKIGLIGISATQARAICDPHLKPRRCLKLQSDGIPGFTYFGKLSGLPTREFYKNEHRYITNGIIPVDHGDDEISITQKILALPDRIYNNKKIVKVVLVMTDTLTEVHQSIAKTLTDAFPRVLVRIVNSSNDVGSRLADIFDELSTTTSPEIYEKLATGGLFIIGDRCFAASVSVRPPPGVEIKFMYQNEDWQLFALTDQIYQATNGKGVARSLEQNMQAMRLFGQYPPELYPRLWIMGTEREEKINQRRVLIDQGFINEELVHRYDGSIESISTYKAKYMKFELFENDPYCLPAGSPSKYQIEFEQTKPTGLIGHLHHHETKLYPIGQWLKEDGVVQYYSDKLYPWTKLSDFHKHMPKKDTPDKMNLGSVSQQDQHELKRTIQEACRRRGLLIPNHFLVPYTASRYEAIIRCSVHPKQDQFYQAASFLSGEFGAETRLSDLYLVMFDDPILYSDIPSSRNNDDWNYYFQITPTKYAVIHKTNTTVSKYTHKYQKEYELSDDHYKCLKHLEVRVLDSIKNGKPKNCYHLFQAFCKQVYGNANALKWKNSPYENLFRQFATEELSVRETITRFYQTPSTGIIQSQSESLPITRMKPKNCYHLFQAFCKHVYGNANALKWKNSPYESLFRQFASEGLSVQETIAKIHQMQILIPLAIQL